MGGLSRRTLLAGGAAALAGCSNQSSTKPAPTPTSPPTSTGPAAVSPPSWGRLARSLDGALVRPGDASFDALRLTPNPRYDAARPLALVEAASTDDLAAGFAFATARSLPVALRSGGHCYAGWSAGAKHLVLDTRRMNQIRWYGAQVEVGAGVKIGDLYPQLGARGRIIPTGSCPTVGVTGLTLGGGVGVLTRAFGLTCDHLVSAVVVLPDGQVVTASAQSHDDLFWALRGGGGGHPGAVASLRFATVAAPTVTSTYLTWPASRAAAVIPAWFDWIGSAGDQMWSTIKLLGGSTHADGPSLGATVTWVGPGSGFDAALAPLLSTGPASRTDHTRSYADTMTAYAGSGAREAFAATSRVAYAVPSAASLADLLAQVTSTPAGLTEAGVSFDALGGRVAGVAPSASAFVHRTALATVQFTATYDGPGAATASRWVATLRGTLAGLGQHAYINYVDPSLPASAYFGDNLARLRRVWASYDPGGVLRQPL